MENPSGTITDTTPPSVSPKKRHKPGWVGRAGEILQQLRETGYPLDGLGVQALFQVKERQARAILGAAGAARQGKALVVQPEQLARYVKFQAPEGFERVEMARRYRFGQNFLDMEREFIAHRPVLVELPDADVAHLQDAAFDALPGNVAVGPGEIRISFRTGDEARQLLMKLALAIGAAGEDAFDRLVNLPEPARIDPQVERAPDWTRYCHPAAV